MARQCTHARRGIVTTHPDGGIPANEAHAARSVCDRPECITAAQQWVASKANRTAYFRPDGAR